MIIRIDSTIFRRFFCCRDLSLRFIDRNRSRRISHVIIFQAALRIRDRRPDRQVITGDFAIIIIAYMVCLRSFIGISIRTILELQLIFQIIIRIAIYSSRYSRIVLTILTDIPISNFRAASLYYHFSFIDDRLSIIYDNLVVSQFLIRSPTESIIPSIFGDDALSYIGSIAFSPSISVDDVSIGDSLGHYIRAVPVVHHQLAGIVAILAGIESRTISGGYIVELQMDFRLIDLCRTCQIRFFFIDFVVGGRIPTKSEFTGERIVSHILSLHVGVVSVVFHPTVGVGYGDLVVFHVIHCIPVGITCQGIGVRRPGFRPVGGTGIPYSQGQLGLVYRSRSAVHRNSIIVQCAVGSPCKDVGPGVLGPGPFGNLVWIRGIPVIGIAEEAVSQYGRLSIPVHQPVGGIDGIAVSIGIKDRAVSSGYIPHIQHQWGLVHGNSAAAGNLIVG